MALTRGAAVPRNSSLQATASGLELQSPYDWGAAPALSLLSALGILIEALAAQGGRDSAWWADPAFWAGLLLIFAPIFLRLTQRSVRRGERVALLLVLGLSLYLVKVAQYPLNFGQPDEYQHWRTALDIAQTGHLFQANNLLPVSPLYPGLEIVTNAVCHATGMSILEAAFTVVGVARILLMLALFLFFERVCGSHHMAAIGAALYVFNPLYLLFDAQYGYESLAIPMAAAILFVAVARGQTNHGGRFGWNAILWLSFAAIAVTHHLTAFALSAFLLLWSVIYVIFQRTSPAKKVSPLLVLAGSIEFNLAWLLIAGQIVLGYLSPDIIGGVINLLQIISGTGAPRMLFQDRAGTVAPIWERLVSIGGVGLLTLGIAVGLVIIWRRFRASIAVLALGIIALIYPASQVFRLTGNGAELATRPMGLIFIAAAFTAGMALRQWWSIRRRSLLWKPLAFTAVIVVFVSGCITGTAPNWQRLPGPYIVEGDGRAIGPDNVAAARWAQTALGQGNLVAADRVDAMLMATYGYQTVTSNRQNETLMPVFFAPSIGVYELQQLRSVPVHYIVIDLRLATALPATGVYYDPGGMTITQPISLQALAKYDSTEGMGRVYDNGAIVIYDAGLLNGSENAP